MNIENMERVAREDIIDATKASTAEVFSTMLGLDIQPSEGSAERSAVAGPSAEIMALIGLAGNWSGTGTIACTGRLACKLGSHFLSTTFDSVNEDVLDAMGEIANMIIGNVKTALEEKVGPIGLSTPTVIHGLNFQSRHARNQESILVPFDCGGERLDVQMHIAPDRNPADLSWILTPRGGRF